MTITAITEKTISTETEMGELLVKILHRLDRQTQKTEFLQAENAELRQRIEKLERADNEDLPIMQPRKTANKWKQVILGNKPVEQEETPTYQKAVHGAKYETTSPVHSSTARKE